MSKWYKFGRYYLLRHIATGGMAEIFLSKQIGLEGFEKLLVVKKILNQYLENEEFITMFLDEARLAAKLDHPNIVRIYDLGKQDKNYYIAMEYIPGEDLRTILRKVSKKSKLIPQQHTLHIISSVCEALDYAHKKKDSNGQPLGIIHRDISPQNVMVSYEGNVKLLDFGIAKASTQSNETEAGVLKGKYAYMSPEQAKGQELDNRSDIFSVGILLFEMLTNHRLFKASNQLDTLKKLVYEDIPSPREFNPDIDEVLEAIVMKALEKDIDRRYKTSREFQKDIEDYLANNRLIASTTRVSEFMHETFEEEIDSLQTLEQKIDEEQKELSVDDISDISKNDGAVQLDTGLSSFRMKSGGNTSLSSWSKLGTSVTNSSYNSQSGVFSAQSPTDSGFLKSKKTLFIAASIFMLAIIAFLSITLLSKSDKKEVGTVYIKSIPPSATILVNDKKYNGLTPTIIKNMPLNELIILKVKKAGFEDEVQELKLTSTETLTVKLELTESKENVGIFKVTSIPSGATIYLDSKKLDKVTPATIEGTLTGKHTLLLDLKGYEPMSFDFNLEKNEFKDINKTLYKVGTPKHAFISMTVEPSDATIMIAEKKLDESGSVDDYEVPYGKDIQVLVKKRGFKTYEVTQNLKRGERVKLDVKLEKKSKHRKSTKTTPKKTVKTNKAPIQTVSAKESGKLNIMTLKDVDIYIDGKKKGKGAISIFLKPGKHSIKLYSKNKLINYRTTVRLKANQELTRTIMLKTGKLSVSAKPWADVFINNKKLAQTPFAPKELYEGSYKITLKNPKYPPYTKTIKINPKKTTLIIKDFKN